MKMVNPIHCICREGEVIIRPSDESLDPDETADE